MKRPLDFEGAMTDLVDWLFESGYFPCFLIGILVIVLIISFDSEMKTTKLEAELDELEKELRERTKALKK